MGLGRRPDFRNGTGGRPVSQLAPEIVIRWSPQGWHGHLPSGGRPLTPAECAGKRALVAVTRRSMFARTTRVPNTDRSTIRQVLTVRVADLFPLAVGEAAFDFILTDDTNESGRLAVVFATGASDIRNLRAQISAANVKIIGIVPEVMGAVLVAKEAHLTDAALVGCADEGMTVDILSGGALVLSRTTAGGAAATARRTPAQGSGCGDQAPGRWRLRPSASWRGPVRRHGCVPAGAR